MERLFKIAITSHRSMNFPRKELTPNPEEEWDDLEDWEEEERFEPVELPKEDPYPPFTTKLEVFGYFSHEEDGSFRIRYEDSEVTGLDGCITTFCLTVGGTLVMLRQGEVKTCMAFEPGCRHLCDYGKWSEITPITVHTHAVHSDLTESGGFVTAHYSVEIRGSVTERNVIEIKVGD